MSDTVTMRDLWGEHHPLTTLHTAVNGAVVIDVPGFGLLVVGLSSSPELIVRLGDPWLAAALFRPPETTPSRRLDAVRVDGGWEVELLPNVSGEDRLVVCVPDAALPGSEPT